MSKTPEQLIYERGIDGTEAVEVDESADDILAREDEESDVDGFGSDADVREARIEMDNQAMEDLAEQAGETGSETIDRDEPLVSQGFDNGQTPLFESAVNTLSGDNEMAEQQRSAHILFPGACMSS